MILRRGYDSRVAIVGAGPVGMVAALALHHRAVPVVVIESEPDEVRTEWRGSTIHPPTLEIFDELGIASSVLEGGVRLERMVYRDLELDLEASFPYELLSDVTRFPHRIQYEQYKVIRHLKDALASNGIPVLFEHSVTGFSQDDEGVTIDIDSPTGHRTIHVEWMLGADGARSTVRKSLNIDFPGFTYPTQSLIVATGVDLENYVERLPPVSYWTGPRGRVSVIRTPDIWRLALTTRLGVDDDYTYAGDNPHPSFVDGMSRLTRGTLDHHDTDLKQHQFYRSHQRLASTFKVGRVLLAGDAAHLSSTTGGMGLNSGVHDAYQFALSFEQPEVEGALARYADGRRRIAERLVQPVTTGNRAGTDLLELQHRKERLLELRKQAEDPTTARGHLFTASMLGAAGLELGEDVARS